MVTQRKPNIIKYNNVCNVGSICNDSNSNCLRIFQYVNGIEYTGATASFLGMTYYTGITGAQLVGAVVSSGIFAGIGIIYGHELAHTKGFSFLIARWMMGLSGSAHFCYAHVYNHHLELGCENDPATAPRGRSLYAHLPKSHFGQSKFLYTMEKQRLKRLGVPFLSWQNRWIRGYAMSLPTIALFWYAGAWTGIACMALIWLISNFELEALNYLEHYGLIRETGSPPTTDTAGIIQHYSQAGSLSKLEDKLITMMR